MGRWLSFFAVMRTPSRALPHSGDRLELHVIEPERPRTLCQWRQANVDSPGRGRAEHELQTLPVRFFRNCLRGRKRRPPDGVPAERLGGRLFGGISVLTQADKRHSVPTGRYTSCRRSSEPSCSAVKASDCRLLLTIWVSARHVTPDFCCEGVAVQPVSGSHLQSLRSPPREFAAAAVNNSGVQPWWRCAARTR